MGTKDRERARKRRAILRAQRDVAPQRGDEDGDEQPADGGRRPGADKRGGRDRRGGGRRTGQPVSPFSHKGKAGDTDHRGRVRTRDQVVHPRITFFVLLGAFLLALPGLLNQDLQVLTWVAYTVAFLALADLARTKVQSFLCLGGAAFAVALLASQVSLLVAG